MSGPEVTKSNLLDCQVCVPKDWEDSQVLEFAESVNSSGTGGWSIRLKGDPALGGDPERQPCTDRDDFVHIMLDA